MSAWMSIGRPGSAKPAMAAMTKLDLSHAYPFTSLSFVLVLIASGLFLNEPVTWPKIAGIALICGGIAIGSQG